MSTLVSTSKLVTRSPWKLVFTARPVRCADGAGTTFVRTCDSRALQRPTLIWTGHCERS
ncbi:xylitol dehydrogenase [Cryptococcus neoformans MW-RSA36]|nr:xylitol dehydrogenase [Cryptococcus neoformans var. grubii MW-RSA36]